MKEGGIIMKKKGKSISFDAMVKFFMQHYHIPTKKDVEKILSRIDQLEAKVKLSGRAARGKVKGAAGRTARGKGGATALDTVYEQIAKNKNGIGLKEITEKTGFNDKKVRNILFRLTRNNRIKRKSRGIYTTA